MEDDCLRQETFHKGETRKSYTIEFKRSVIKFAQDNSNGTAAEKYKVDRKRVREWIRNKEKIFDTKSNRMRIDGAGRKLSDESMEEEILRWIHECHAKMLRCYVYLVNL